MPTTDTTIEAARLQRRILADKTVDERTAMAFEMSELVRQLVIDRIHRRHPVIAPSDVTLKLIERLHGRKFVTTGWKADTQRRDVIEMIIANIDSLDRDYLEMWAAELGLTGLLLEVWNEANTER